jgi:SAM-dependent methyltransferase
MLDRYLARAVSGVLDCKWPVGAVRDERRARIDALRWASGSRAALETLGCALHEHVAPAHVPLKDASMDLVHSGGALEHLAPEELDSFIGECHRILRPGGIASHVFDHRDHLYHADKRWPFLAHQALPKPIYSALFGHPLLFHNRLLPEEICRRFEAAGFKRIAVRRMILPAGRYVPDEEVTSGLAGLPRRLQRAQLSPLDLHTAAAHYLFARF